MLRGATKDSIILLYYPWVQPHPQWPYLTRLHLLQVLLRSPKSILLHSHPFTCLLIHLNLHKVLLPAFILSLKLYPLQHLNMYLLQHQISPLVAQLLHQHSPIFAGSANSSAHSMRPTRKKKESDPLEDVPYEKYLPFAAHTEAIRSCLDNSRVVGNELKGMKAMQRKLAKKLINDVIHFGNMKMLTMDHQVLKLQSSCSCDTLK